MLALRKEQQLHNAFKLTFNAVIAPNEYDKHQTAGFEGRQTALMQFHMLPWAVTVSHDSQVNSSALNGSTRVTIKLNLIPHTLNIHGCQWSAA
jgi:hypothetical protein